MSGVEPMQLIFQPGMTAVAGNQGCKHCLQNFANKALLQIHIQDSHMEKFPPQLSTVTVSNRQKLKEDFGKAQEASRKSVNKNPVVGPEDSRANAISPTQSLQQSHFSLALSRNADVGNQRGNLCTQTMINDSHHQIQMESQMPQSAPQLSTVDAGKSQDITEQFQETPQRSQTSSVVRLEDSRESFILPGQSGQQSCLPPVSNSNAVGDKQICGQSKQSFKDKIHHPFYIQGKHMAELPSYMSTINAGKCDDSRTTHLVQHQAPARPNTKRPVVGLEHSSGNFMPKVSGLQSPLSPVSSTASPKIRTGISNFNCSICGIGFKEMHAFNIHMFTHMGSKGTLYTYKGATPTSHDRRKTFQSITELKGNAQ